MSKVSVLSCHSAMGWIGQALLSGDYEALLDCYAERVAVFMPRHTYFLRNREELRQALAEHRAGALPEGARALTCEVVATGLPRGPRRTLYLDWRYDFGPDRAPRHALANYFVADHGYGPRVEMIEYRSLAFAHADCWHRGRGIARHEAQWTGS